MSFRKAPFKPIINACTSPECARSRGVRKSDTHPSGARPCSQGREQDRQRSLPASTSGWRRRPKSQNTQAAQTQQAGGSLWFLCAEQCSANTLEPNAPFRVFNQAGRGSLSPHTAGQSAMGKPWVPITPLFLIPALGTFKMGAWRPQR